MKGEVNLGQVRSGLGHFVWDVSKSLVFLFLVCKAKEGWLARTRAPGAREATSRLPSPAEGRMREIEPFLLIQLSAPFIPFLAPGNSFNVSPYASQCF